ncbi:MAG TPA: indole-3-glycerol phosphate synthase TrpC [Gammaproteobacteria bacterium]|nr:indole-3-glycerol phosphate synthase TrpC [Gammaproteobacteria bacterium]
MSFLERMAAASRERVQTARAAESEAKLARRAERAPKPPRLALGRFDVIAEVKLRSPAAGGLANTSFDATAQLDAYAGGGAAAVSVLTEPTEFKGELAHLASAAERLAPRRVPAMRKDFVTDPYQVLEARAAGAGGILVIVTMLDDDAVRTLVASARECGLFVLLEAFDARDLERIAVHYDDDAGLADPPILAGVNCRDLRDLDVRFTRFAELAPNLPKRLPCVAESGIATAADVATVSSLGYRLALVGSSLMRAADPRAALAGFVAAGRAAREA